MCLDWRGEFLRVIQEAFEKEREMLKVELQPRVGDSDPRDCSCLLERLEKVVQEQVSTASIRTLEPPLVERVTEPASDMNFGFHVALDLRTWQ